MRLTGMRSRESLSTNHRLAWRLAAEPMTAAELIEAAPGTTPQILDNMVRLRILTLSGGLYRAVPGLEVPRHEAPRQSIQAASVWEYARRCVA